MAHPTGAIALRARSATATLGWDRRGPACGSGSPGRITGTAAPGWARPCRPQSPSAAIQLQLEVLPTGHSRTVGTGSASLHTLHEGDENYLALRRRSHLDRAGRWPVRWWGSRRAQRRGGKEADTWFATSRHRPWPSAAPLDFMPACPICPSTGGVT